jgi:hypothetical protein
MPSPDDDAFVAAFEAGRLETFRHRDHVRLAWVYLAREDAPRALERFCRELRVFATARARPELYHETITWAFVMLIRERRERAALAADFEAFARRNPDLLEWKPSILERYYRAETLASDLARRVFLMPDLPERAPILSADRSGTGTSRTWAR